MEACLVQNGFVWWLVCNWFLFPDIIYNIIYCVRFQDDNNNGFLSNCSQKSKILVKWGCIIKV